MSSPRSLKALRNLGLVEQDLHYLSREELRRQGVNGEFHDDIEFFLDVKQQHIKERVDQLLAQLRQEHVRLAEKSFAEERQQQSSMKTSFYTEKLAQKQQLMLKTLRNKQGQQIEIERQIQEEIRIEQMAQKSKLKEDKLREQQARQQEELLQRHAELELKAQEREKKFQDAKQREAEKNAQIARLQAETEQRLRLKQTIQETLKNKEREENEQKRQRKLEKLSFRLQSQQSQTEYENMVRQATYQQKLQSISKKLAEQQRLKQQENQLAEQQAQLKLQSVNAMTEEETRQAEERLRSHEQLAQQRQQKLKEEQSLRKQLKRQKEFHKMSYIQQQKYALMHQQLRENDDLRNREQQFNERKATFDRLKSFERKMLSTQREQKFDQTSRSHVTLLKLSEHQKSEQYRQKELRMQEKELKRQERLREARRKHIVDFLKAEDVLQNNIRLQRIEEMKHSRTMQKLEETDRKFKQFQLEQSLMIENKRKLEKQLETEKQQILKNMDGNKSEYLNKSHVSVQYKSTGSLINNKSYEISPVKEPRHDTLNRSSVQPSEQRSSSLAVIVAVQHVQRPLPVKQERSLRNLRPTTFLVDQNTFNAVQLYANGNQQNWNFDVKIALKKKVSVLHDRLASQEDQACVRIDLIIQMKKQTKLVSQEDIYKEIKEKTGLALTEIDQIRVQFTRLDQKAAGVLTRSEIDELFKDMQLYKRHQVQRWVHDEIKTSSSKTYDLKQLCELIVETRKYILDLEEEETITGEYIDAFVAMGGNADRSGYIQKDTIIDIIQNEFELTFDIEEFLEELGGQHQIDFDTFCMVFEQGGEDAKSVISVPILFYFEAFSERARKTSAAFNVRLKDFERWEASLINPTAKKA